MASYQPGVCNIGRVERRRRLGFGVASFLLAGFFTAWLVATDGPAQYFVGTFVFLTGGFVGYLQYRLHFCVAFASLARYDLAGSGDDAGSVTEREFLWKDRRRAAEILLYAVGLAAAVTLFVYALHLFVVNPPRA